MDAVKMPMREMASIWRRKIHIYINNNSPFNPNKRFHSNWASAGWVNKITTQRNRDETEHSIADDCSGLDQKSCLFLHIVWVFSSISVCALFLILWFHELQSKRVRWALSQFNNSIKCSWMKSFAACWLAGIFCSFLFFSIISNSEIH